MFLPSFSFPSLVVRYVSMSDMEDVEEIVMNKETKYDEVPPIDSDTSDEEEESDVEGEYNTSVDQLHRSYTRCLRMQAYTQVDWNEYIVIPLGLLTYILSQKRDSLSLFHVLYLVTGYIVLFVVVKWKSRRTVRRNIQALEAMIQKVHDGDIAPDHKQLSSFARSLDVSMH